MALIFLIISGSYGRRIMYQYHEFAFVTAQHKDIYISSGGGGGGAYIGLKHLHVFPCTVKMLFWDTSPKIFM